MLNLKIFKVLLLLCMLFIISTTELPPWGSKKLFEKCNWQALGSQCLRGLQCAKLKGICLKKNGEHCTSKSECHGLVCFLQKCH